MKPGGTTVRSFHFQARRIGLAAGLFVPLCLTPGPVERAKAADCNEGKVVVGTGSVGDIFRNKKGTWTIGVAHGHAECLEHFIYVVSDRRPPSSCHKGAQLTASFEIQDMLFEMDFKKLVKLNCE